MVSLLIILLLLFSLATSDHITEVFKSFDELRYEGPPDYTFLSPNNRFWVADLSWEIDGSRMKLGDTFTLIMPCVFSFATDLMSLHLTVDYIDYANCLFSPGDVSFDYSELECVLLPTVNDSTKVNGKISVPVIFNAGYSSSEIDLKCSEFFQDGVNTVSFYDGSNVLSTQATFEGGSFGVPTTIGYALRDVPSVNKQQQFLLQGACTNGTTQGLLGIRIFEGTGSIDCASMNAFSTNSLTDWFHPKVADTFQYEWSCGEYAVSFLYHNMEKGSRVFLEGFINRKAGVNLLIEYVNKFECNGSDTIYDASKMIKLPAYSYVGAEVEVAKDIDVNTRTWTGSTTHMRTMDFSRSDEIVSVFVELPIPTTTITSSHIGISTSYATLHADPGVTATVIEYEPVHTTITQTSCWADEESSTTTISDPNVATDTVLIMAPCGGTTEESFAEEPTDLIEESTEDPFEEPTEHVEESKKEPTDLIEESTEDPFEEPTEHVEESKKEPTKAPTKTPNKEPNKEPKKEPNKEPNQKPNRVSSEEHSTKEPTEKPNKVPPEEHSTKELTEKPNKVPPEEHSTKELTEKPTKRPTPEESIKAQIVQPTGESSSRKPKSEEPTAKESSSYKETSLPPSTSCKTTVATSYTTSIKKKFTTSLPGKTTCTTVLTKSVKPTYTNANEISSCTAETCSLITIAIPSGTIPCPYNTTEGSSPTSSVDSEIPKVATYSDIVSALATSPLNLLFVLLITFLI
ncbi:Agglutinin-like protein 1 [Spathaspora sp. JA1]|nr:Agglutinin-like protein 1 [Spathaspora sp. JA1]